MINLRQRKIIKALGMASSSGDTKGRVWEYKTIQSFFFFMLLTVVSSKVTRMTTENGIGEAQMKEDPKPKIWPEQFHSVLVMNNSKTHEVQVLDLWYDWPNGRNLNLIQYQLGKRLYDVEWTNGTSYFYTLDDNRECSIAHVEVGILTPNWLDGATYLGQRQVDGFLCNVWEKVEFIWYYEDVVTKRPVQWIFYTGRAFHVMTFEVGAVLEDSEWQAPVYCFDKEKRTTTLGHPDPILRPSLPLDSI